MTDSVVARLSKRAARSQSAGRLDDALKAWRAVLLADPDNLQALGGLGKVLRLMGRIAESEAVLRTGLERHPAAAALYGALAQTLAAWEATDEAVEAAERAVSLAPKSAAALTVLARLRLERGEDSRARAAFEDALDADPRHLPTLTGLGRMLRQTGDAERAVVLLERAAKIAPNNAEVGIQRALALLSTGKLGAGFRALECRWQCAEMKDLGGLDAMDPGYLPWDGSALGDRTLLVRSEQGLSECLQFCRLLALVEGGRVILEAPPELVPLLRASRVADEVVGRDHRPDAPPPPADLWVPMMSLPDLLSVAADTIPADIPYLRADPSLLSPWRNRLGAGIKIGIAWRGGAPLFENRDRHVPLAAFAPLAALPGVRLISLQKGEGRRDIDEVPFPIEDPTDEMDEGEGAFLDTAAVMESMALIVTADTAIAHLAGGLGRPVWCVLPEGGDWRFGWEKRNCPWYPTMDCFRRPIRGGYEALFSELATRLTAMRAGIDPDAQSNETRAAPRPGDEPPSAGVEPAGIADTLRPGPPTEPAVGSGPEPPGHDVPVPPSTFVPDSDAAASAIPPEKPAPRKPAAGEPPDERPSEGAENQGLGPKSTPDGSVIV